jgi:menaquinone-dependent protoporphyrinogen oxidase
MSNILIAYSTVDGHTLAICSRIRQSLEQDGHSVTLAEIPLRSAADVSSDLAPFDKIVIGASIRYGKHRPAVYDFIQTHREQLQSKPSAFFSVNVVARKPGKDTPQTNPYVWAFRKKVNWSPTTLAVFAGKIDYPKYGFLDRQMIRLIMWLTKGPTDPTACFEFTDWAAVQAFAQQVSRMGLPGEAPP